MYGEGRLKEGGEKRRQDRHRMKKKKKRKTLEEGERKEGLALFFSLKAKREEKDFFSLSLSRDRRARRRSSEGSACRGRRRYASREDELIRDDYFLPNDFSSSAPSRF